MMAMAVTPQPSPTVYESSLAGERVLFNESDRRLHVLNSSAAAVWSSLGDRSTVGELAHRVASQFGVSQAVVDEDVRRVLDRFFADGLVSGNGRYAPPMRSVARRCLEPRGDNCLARVRALDAVIEIDIGDNELRELVLAATAPLSSLDQPTHRLTIDIGANDGCVVTTHEGEPAHVGSRLGAALRAIAEINSLAVESVSRELVFHAGAVAGPNGVALLPGASNHGKSTLTAALVKAGSHYLTDEAAVVDHRGWCRSFPKAIALDPGSFELFPECEPSPTSALSNQLVRREWHIDPKQLGKTGAASPVRVIVCPSWRAGATTRVSRVAPVEALHLLLGNAFDFGSDAKPVFERLVKLAEKVPVYRMGYSRLDEAVACVTGLIDDPTQTV